MYTCVFVQVLGGLETKKEHGYQPREFGINFMESEHIVKIFELKSNDPRVYFIPVFTNWRSFPALPQEHLPISGESLVVSTRDVGATSN
jgi:hypothetical protein